MADRIVRSRLSQCTGKRPYHRKVEAKRAAKVLECVLGRMHPYRCPWCSSWHLGHRPKDA